MSLSLRFITAVALALAASACSTKPPASMAYGPQSSTALLVAANPELLQEIRVEIRRVNLQSNTFEDEQVVVRNSDQINRTAFTGWLADPTMPARLSLHEVPAGHYAVVYMTAAHSNTTTQFYYWRCMYDGAPVFHVPGGQVSVIQLGEYWNPGRIGSQPTSMSDERTLGTFARARTEYPGIEGEPVLVEPSGVIRWASRNAETEPCVNAEVFENFTPEEWAALAAQ